MPEGVYIIEHGKELPKTSAGRPRGSGWNLRLLTKLAKGDSIWEVPHNKMESIRSSAQRANKYRVEKFRLQIRRMPDSNPPLYVIKKLQ